MTVNESWSQAMGRALFLANRAREAGDVPVGAVVLDPHGTVIGSGWNQRETTHDPSAHAEIVALRQAGLAMGTWNLAGCTLVVTLEPCTMCAGAVVNSRVDRLVFGAWDEKAGAAGSLRDVVRDARLNHTVEVIGGVLRQEVEVQLKGFFFEKRSDALHEGRSPRVTSHSAAAAALPPASRSSSTRKTPNGPDTTVPPASPGENLLPKGVRLRGRKRS